MNKEKMIPEIRFVGFIDDWEQHKLGESKDVRDGTHDSPKYHSEGYPLVTSKNLKDSGLDMSDVSLISKKDFDSINKRSNVDIGDILFGMIGTIGKPVIVDRNDFAIKNVALIKNGGELPNSFLIQLFKSSIFDKYILNEHVGNTQKFLGLTKIREFPFFAPSIDEQIKIGLLFKQIDGTITLQQQLLTDYKQFKKALLQQLFPQKGETVPKVRFAGFVDEWESKTLGDYLTIPDKKTKLVKKTEDLITLQLNLKGMYQGSNRETLSFGSTVYYERKAGQFLYGKQNFFNGSMGIIPDELDGKATSGDVPSLDINNINSNFLYTYVSRPTYWKQKEAQASGTGSKRIHEKTLQSFDIHVPKLEEQEKIGQFFKQLDETIDGHELKLATYQDLKKALLQRMFV